MINVHVTPDEFNQLRDAIDQTTRTALFYSNPDIDIRPIVSRVLGDGVAQAIGFQTARLIVHFDNVVPQRLTEVTP